MNRYYDEEELNVPSTNPYLFSNIQILRKEARLSPSELGEKMNVDEITVKDWESNKLIPSTNEIIKLCSILRISHYDMMTRDIKTERNEAGIKLKNSKDRKNYNWYYGDHKVVILNLIYLIGIPLLYVFFVFFWNFVPIDLALLVKLITLFKGAFPYVVAYVGVSLVSGLIISITFMIKHRYRFQFWHIFLISLFITVVELVGLIGTIPYYIYTLVKLIILRGRNHR